MSHGIRIDRDWLILGDLHQTFKTNYCIYLRSAFQISRKKNEKLLNFKNFRQLCRFTLHCESAELAGIWENFKLLANKTLCHFSDLKLIFLYEKLAKNLTNIAFCWTNNNMGHVIQETIEVGQFLLHCHSKIQT